MLIKVGQWTELFFQLIAAGAAVSGVAVAYKLYYNKSFAAAEPERNAWQYFFYKGWKFDLLYDNIFTKPLVFLSRINKNDFIERFYDAISNITAYLNEILRATQNGRLRTYVMAVAVGAVITLTILFYK